MKKRYIFITLLLVLGLFVLKTLYSANFFSEYENYFVGDVQKLESPFGIEDITIDSTNGFAYLSSHNRRNFIEKGAIYLFKINDSTENYINLTENFKRPDFRPHGISFLEVNDSTKFLYVISHADNQNVVEKFRILGESLIHEKSITSPLFVSPNDLHAVSENEIYITNDHTDPKGFLRSVKDFLKIPTGNVVLLDAKNAKIAAEDIAYANGINSWNDKKTFFVASSNTNTLHVFNRLADNSLEKELDFDTGVGVDNIEVDYENNLYIGCHPQLLKFLQHSKNKEALSPTVVLKMVYIPESGYKFIQEGIFIDNGKRLSGGSVAAYYEPKQGEHDDNVMLVGSVFEPSILKLKRNYKAQ